MCIDRADETSVQYYQRVSHARLEMWFCRAHFLFFWFYNAHAQYLLAIFPSISPSRSLEAPTTLLISLPIYLLQDDQRPTALNPVGFFFAMKGKQPNQVRKAHIYKLERAEAPIDVNMKGKPPGRRERNQELDTTKE